ncbi:hypothetical protein QZH41_019868, partial [Actinostola sp. cb2023]
MSELFCSLTKKCRPQNQTHSLEVSPPSRNGILRMDDLSSSEEDMVNGRVRNYENKITSLMSEVGTLKNEVDLQRSQRAVEKKDEQIAASRKILQNQEQELYDFRKELKTTVKENEMLRHSLSKAKEDADLSRNELDRAEDDRGTLLKKLVETEMDGRAVGEQVFKLRDIIRKLKQDKKLSATDSALLTRQRESMLQKLDEFGRTNKGLRRMLQDSQQKEEAEIHLRQQQELLLRKLTDADSKNETFQVEIIERDRQIETLLTQVEADKDQAMAFDDLKKTMETTRAHLQNQFRSKEMENNRLQVQIRNLEEQLEQTRVEFEHLEGILTVSRDKTGREKEALKKAARVQKDRVSDREKEIESVRQKLNDKLMMMMVKMALVDILENDGDDDDAAQLMTVMMMVKMKMTLMVMMENDDDDAAQLMTVMMMMKMTLMVMMENDDDDAAQLMTVMMMELDLLEIRRNESAFRQEKESAEADNAILRNRIKELQDIIENTEKASQSNTELLTSKLSTKAQEVNVIRNENEELRADVAALEERLHDDEQRALNKSYFKSDEIKELKSYLMEYDDKIVEMRKEIDKYRREAEETRSRLYDVEQDTQRLHQETMIETEKQKLKMQQRLSELEPIADILKSTELRLQDSQDRLMTYERRACEHTNLIADLTQKVNCQRLEDLRAENIRLTSQLESSLSEARRQAEMQRDKNVAKERAAQARIVDLETQLSRATASAASMKRAKDE